MLSSVFRCSFYFFRIILVAQTKFVHVHREWFSPGRFPDDIIHWATLFYDTEWSRIIPSPLWRSTDISPRTIIVDKIVFPELCGSHPQIVIALSSFSCFLQALADNCVGFSKTTRQFRHVLPISDERLAGRWRYAEDYV